MNRRISVNTGSAVPQSFITKGKQRLKQHVDTVYLKNGDEFQVELYNPKQNKVLAKIEINGNSIGSGIVLRPGERVFLERYLDVAKKFKFETYLVDGDNKEVENAIRNNGDVTIRFYDEYIQPLWNTGTTTLTTYPNTLIYTSRTPTFNGNMFTTNGLSGTVSTTNAFYSNTSNTFNLNSSQPKSLETGRVEKGSHSDQSFTFDSTIFNSFVSVINTWKLKPQSTKPLFKEDLVVYCTECGGKRKKESFKFCPQCGTKY